jgi:hypothetical protein
MATKNVRQLPIRDMDRATLEAAAIRINPVPEVEDEVKDRTDQELRRALVRHVAGRMTDQQADEVIAREGVSEPEAPRYRIDAIATLELTRHDGEPGAATLTEIQDTLREEIEGSGTLSFQVGLGNGDYGQATIAIEGVEVTARRID